MTSRGEQRTAGDTLHSPPLSWLFVIERLRWKYWKLSRESYYCSVGPGRSSEPKQQCWLERPLKTNLNPPWHKTFISPTDRGSAAPGADWWSRAPCFIYFLWINIAASQSPPHAGVCWDWTVRTWGCMCCMRVINGKCETAAMPTAALMKVLLCSMIELLCLLLPSLLLLPEHPSSS